MNKISYVGLKKVLTPKEMKNITGGSCTITCKEDNDDITTFYANSCGFAESLWCGGAELLECCCG